MRAKYTYFVEVTETTHKCVSAKEFKELSHHWIADDEDENGITIYRAEGIECGRKVRCIG